MKKLTLRFELGLLLAVVAVRILRKSEAGEKILGVALLCGGLPLGTFGARNAEALIENLNIEGPDCGSTATIFHKRYDPAMPTVKNTCDETCEMMECRGPAPAITFSSAITSPARTGHSPGTPAAGSAAGPG